MKLLYYLASIGDNNYDEKLNILNHNLEYLYEKNKFNFDIIINLYNTDDESYEKINNLIKNKNYIEKYYIYVKQGVLTELFLTNPHNKHIEKYQYILFILDDVKIINYDLKKMIEYKKKYQFEFISPKIINSTYKYMNNLKECVVLSNILEIYLILCDKQSFKNFLDSHTIKNKWIWGYDLLFGYNGIKVGINYNDECQHFYKGGGNFVARKLGDEYIKEKTGLNLTLQDIYNTYKNPIKKIYPNDYLIFYH